MFVLKRRLHGIEEVRLREPTDAFLLKSLVPFALLILASGPLGGWGHAPLVVSIVAWSLLTACVLLLFRSWQIGVYIRTDGIKVVNMRTRQWCAWSQIDSFSIGYPEARSWKWSPVVTLTNGSRLPMIGIQAPQPWTRPSNDFDQRAVAQLESLLAEARANGGVLDSVDLEFEPIK